jgi:O-antigen ligase
VFQAVYMLQQWLGYDVLWGPLVGGQLKDTIQPLGTLGTVDAASAYVAVTAPIMPVWALPIAIGVVAKGHSIGAIIALFVGLLIRYHRSWKLTTAIVAFLLAVYVKWFMFTPDWAHTPTSVKVRLAIWWFAIKDLLVNGPIHGLYSWSSRFPALQLKTGYRPYTNEVWMEAHNEYLQWVYEYGLVGLAVLVLWLREHRAMFRDAAVGASLCALAIVSGSFFTFHVVSVALLGLALVALATPFEPTREA